MSPARLNLLCPGILNTGGLGSFGHTYSDPPRIIPLQNGWGRSRRLPEGAESGKRLVVDKLERSSLNYHL